MKLSINIEDPKYRIGDVLRIKHTKNDKQLILHVIRIECKGGWSALAYTDKPEISITHNIDRLFYTLVVQDDSYTSNDACLPLDAGSVFLFSHLTLDERDVTVIEFDKSKIVDARRAS